MSDTRSPHTDLTQQFIDRLRENDVDSVRRHIIDHPELRKRINEPIMSFDSPPLVDRVSSGNREMVDLLLEFGADIRAKSQWWAGGFGVLENAPPELAEYLIERGARLDVHAAARLGKLDELKALVDEDPDRVHAIGGDGQTPMHYAKTPEIMDFLLERGADIDARDIDHGGTPAQHALSDPDRCRALIERGAQVDIFLVCALGDPDLARRLVEQDPACIDARIGEGPFTSGESQGGHIYVYTRGLGYTARPLQVASDHGHADILNVLLEHASDVQAFLFHCAQANRNAVQEILERNPDIVRQLKPEDARLVSDMAWVNRLDAVKAMLDAGFDVDTPGVHGSTPLDRAAIRGYREMVKLVLQYRPDLEAKNEFGGTPLSACVWGSIHFRDPEGDYPGVLQVLIEAGGKLPDKLGGSEAVRGVFKGHGVSE